jgi:hypothetical protein
VPLGIGKGTPSYTMSKVFRDGGYRNIVRFRCAKCDRSEALVWTTGNNPDFIKRRALTMGWLFDPFQRSSCVCPDCHKRGGGNMPQTPPKNVVELKTTEFVKEVTVRNLTTDEKARVRGLLDEHFDDSTCRYIDGYSDKRIGEELEVPWSAVMQIREFAYGPIKEDERLVIIRAEAKALSERIDRFCTEITGVSKRLDQLRNEQDKLVSSQAALLTRFKEIGEA